MTESTKALNSAASTLKKNPGRVDRLVKAAKFLIVPPKQYATGKARELAEAAIKKLKAKRGLNGVVGEGAGPFSDKALQKKAEDKKGAGYAAAGGVVGAGVGRALARDYQKSTITLRSGHRVLKQVAEGKPSGKIHAATPVFNRRAAKTLKGAGRLGALAGAVTGAIAGLGARKIQMEKKAVDKKTQDRALAATAVGSGAAIGGMLTHDAKKSRVASRLGTKGAYKHMADSSVKGAEKRLADSAKVMRRMGKPLKRAGIKGAIVGGLAGAALGAAQLKKQAGEDMKDLVKEAGSILASRTVQQRAQQAFKHFKDKDVRVAALKRAAKTGALAGGIAGAGAVVTKKNDQLKKQAAELVIKDGKKYRKGTVSSAANTMAAVNGALRAVGKGGVKGVAKAALNGGMLGGAYGTVRGANRLRKGEVSLSADEMKKVRGLKKKAAELIHHKGEDIRRGTVGSAAGKMALGGAALGGLAGLAAGPVGGIAGAAYGATQGAIAGGLYGIVRGALRAQDGEKSMTPHKFDQLKAKIA